MYLDIPNIMNIPRNMLLVIYIMKWTERICLCLVALFLRANETELTMVIMSESFYRHESIMNILLS